MALDSGLPGTSLTPRDGRRDIVVTVAIPDGGPPCRPGSQRAAAGCRTSSGRAPSPTGSTPDDPLRAEYPEAQLVVRVRARAVYPNCPRYVHRYELVRRSRFVPREDCLTPVPEWKRSDWASDVLPEHDPARAPGEREVLGR